MSFTSPARSRLRSRAAIALAGSAAALAAVAPSASADFTLAKCRGQTTQAAGASFQTTAQAGFKEYFAGPDECGSAEPTVDYASPGSGAGRRALGERGSANVNGTRDPAIRFAGSDEPPTPAQTDQIEQGPVQPGTTTDVQDTDDGDLHTIPVAAGAVTVDVNFPNGCVIPAASRTTPAVTTDETDRIKLPITVVEKIFGADDDANTWGKIVPGISGTYTGTGGPTNPEPGDACENIPVRRVVRRDNSGTTFAFKDFFANVNPNRTPVSWQTLIGRNTEWPNTINESSAATCPENSNLCKAAGDGGGSLLSLLTVTEGGVGYGDLATARARGYESTPGSNDSNPATNDTTYWVPLVNASGTSFEPTTDAKAFKTNVGVRGSNCGNVPFRNLPASTLGDWSAVSGAQGAGATIYPACTLTYALAFDDNAAVYGVSGTEEGRARTVKDYISAAVSSLGQTTLAPRDYSALPGPVRNLAQSGASNINWNKKANVATPPQAPQNPPANNPGDTPGGGTSTTTTNVVQPVTVISNQFSITSARISKNRIRLTLRAPGRGEFNIRATARIKRGGKTRTIRFGSTRVNVSKAGTVSVSQRFSATALRELRRIKRSARVKVAISFKPTGGSNRTATRTLTARLSK